jgi:hypothetical protein
MRLSAPLISLLALAGLGARAQTPDAGRFDGAWDVAVDCPASQDGAAPFSFDFTAVVRGGVLHGERGVAGQPGWMSLDGPISPDGAASLQARGLTGATQYSIGGAARGVPYRHPVAAHFDGARGAGQWVTIRTCPFTFTKR